MTKPIVGLWIDDAPRLVSTAAYWDELQAHGVRTAALMLESFDDGFDSAYGVDMLANIREHRALPRDIEIVLTVVPEPRVPYMRDFEARIGAYLAAAGAAAIEGDLEGNWMKAEVQGYPSLDAAGDHLVQVFDRLGEKHDVRDEVTTYPFHQENSRTADVAPHVARLLAQAYSVRNRSDRGKPIKIEWDGAYGPGKMQRLSLDRARTVPGKHTMSVGLAAYDQKFPGRTGEDAMRAAWDAVLPYEPAEVRFWSSKWVVGAKANGYASRFLKALAKS